MSEIERAVFVPYNGHFQIDADLHTKARNDYTLDLERERDALREWKETAEDLLGQRGVENISAMLEIIQAAMDWADWYHGDFKKSRGPDVRTGLSRAVKAYKNLVAARVEGSS